MADSWLPTTTGLSSEMATTNSSSSHRSKRSFDESGGGGPQDPENDQPDQSGGNHNTEPDEDNGGRRKRARSSEHAMMRRVDSSSSADSFSTAPEENADDGGRAGRDHNQNESFMDLDGEGAETSAGPDDHPSAGPANEDLEATPTTSAIRSTVPSVQAVLSVTEPPDLTYLSRPTSSGSRPLLNPPESSSSSTSNAAAEIPSASQAAAFSTAIDPLRHSAPSSATATEVPSPSRFAAAIAQAEQRSRARDLAVRFGIPTSLGTSRPLDQYSYLIGQSNAAGSSRPVRSRSPSERVAPRTRSPNRSDPSPTTSPLTPPTTTLPTFGDNSEPAWRYSAINSSPIPHTVSPPSAAIFAGPSHDHDLHHRGPPRNNYEAAEAIPASAAALQDAIARLEQVVADDDDLITTARAQIRNMEPENAPATRMAAIRDALAGMNRRIRETEVAMREAEVSLRQARTQLRELVSQTSFAATQSRLQRDRLQDFFQNRRDSAMSTAQYEESRRRTRARMSAVEAYLDAHPRSSRPALADSPEEVAPPDWSMLGPLASMRDGQPERLLRTRRNLSFLRDRSDSLQELTEDFIEDFDDPNDIHTSERTSSIREDLNNLYRDMDVPLPSRRPSGLSPSLRLGQRPSVYRPFPPSIGQFPPRRDSSHALDRELLWDQARAGYGTPPPHPFDMPDASPLTPSFSLPNAPRLPTRNLSISDGVHIRTGYTPSTSRNNSIVPSPTGTALFGREMRMETLPVIRTTLHDPSTTMSRLDEAEELGRSPPPRAWTVEESSSRGDGMPRPSIVVTRSSSTSSSAPNVYEPELLVDPEMDPWIQPRRFATDPNTGVRQPPVGASSRVSGQALRAHVREPPRPVSTTFRSFVDRMSELPTGGEDDARRDSETSQATPAPPTPSETSIQRMNRLLAERRQLRALPRPPSSIFRSLERGESTSATTPPAPDQRSRTPPGMDFESLMAPWRTVERSDSPSPTRRNVFESMRSRRFRAHPAGRDMRFEPTYDEHGNSLDPGGAMRFDHFLRGRFGSDMSMESTIDGLLRGLVAPAGANVGLNPQDVALLPTATYKDCDEAKKEERCPICLDDYDDNDTVMGTTECNHFFHQACFSEWLKTKRTCPYCRQNIEPRRPHRHNGPNGPSRRPPPPGSGGSGPPTII